MCNLNLRKYQRMKMCNRTSCRFQNLGIWSVWVAHKRTNLKLSFIRWRRIVYGIVEIKCWWFLLIYNTKQIILCSTNMNILRRSQRLRAAHSMMRKIEPQCKVFWWSDCNKNALGTNYWIIGTCSISPRPNLHLKW